VASYHGTRCAIKEMNCAVVDANAVAKFKAELNLIGGLRHPSIVQCVGVCWEEPNYCMIAELCSNGSLDKLLTSDGKTLTWAKNQDAVSNAGK